MKTEQEQIEKIQEIINDCYEFEPISAAISSDDRYVYIDTEEIAKAIVEAGYGDVTEYKSEIERLRQEVRDTDKMARNSIEQYKNNYDNAFERLKAQEREIDKLKDDYANLQELFAQYQMASDKEIMAQRKQTKIDVLNELREKYSTSGSVNSNWATIIFVDDIDELIEEVENDK